MGCTQSKIENEETVNRCKERKQYMERAVTARNKFAAAHSAHAMSLKNTGAALSDYAHGEVVDPAGGGTSGGGVADATLQPPLPPYDNFLPPPPLPPFNQTSSPLQRASTVPELRTELKHTNSIIDEENEEDIENESTHSLKHRSSKSSGRGGVGGRGGLSQKEVTEDEVLQKPPLPVRPNERERERELPAPPPPPDNKGMSWDYFFSTDEMPGSTLADVEDDHYKIEEIERKMREERAKKSEMDDEVEGGRRVEQAEAATEVVEGKVDLPPQPPPTQTPAVTKVAKRVKMVPVAEGKTKVGPSFTNLLKIFVDLDDCFLKACESAHEVSRLLEATRLHYHSNFADKKVHMDHSARVMRVITWNRSFKGQQTDDGVDDIDTEEHETHATVLDKMLAWEKKLYDEVKAGELMKIEYQKKVASLNKLKKHGSNTDALERMKASVSHLHTRYIVDMQSMDSTVSEINSLRDDQLYPKLVTLVDSMATMWETMRMYHEKQSKIVQALRHLDISQSPKETTDHHHERTRQLCGVVQEWHSHFSELMSQQKEYIKALNSWLKLNLIPIDTNLKEKVSSPRGTQNPPILTLLHAWHDYLEKIPDEPTKATINNFAAVIQTIWQYQKEELDLRSRCAESRKEVMKKTREFENWYNKYTQRRTPPDEMDEDKDLIAERQHPVEAATMKLKGDEEAYQRQCVQVREKSLMSLKSNLPGLFQGLSDFSLACSDMYSNLKSIAHSQNKSRG